MHIKRVLIHRIKNSLFSKQIIKTVLLCILQIISMSSLVTGDITPYAEIKNIKNVSHYVTKITNTKLGVKTKCSHVTYFKGFIKQNWNYWIHQHLIKVFRLARNFNWQVWEWDSTAVVLVKLPAVCSISLNINWGGKGKPSIAITSHILIFACKDFRKLPHSHRPTFQ